MHRKGAQDKKRAKIFTKAMREIFVAAKSGAPDPEMNSRLRNAISDAKAVNLPKDKIEGAIKRAASKGEVDNHEELRYEGYGPCGVPFIVEALSDNRNRTGGEIRSIFSKNGGSLGAPNSASFMFNHYGLFFYEKSEALTYESLLESALVLGIDECIEYDDGVKLLCSPAEFHKIKEELIERHGRPDEADILWIPKDPVRLSEEEKEKVSKFINILDAVDDVQNVYGNCIIED